ncbi:hypothetical protein BDZ97DRAFT_1779193 [Flammula alnicola]|nr:hypothetical protein BDZ97DRAFT_1779193 [Flammula alnicola]
MPPKTKPGGHSSKDLVPVGRRDVFSKTNPARQHGKRDEHGQKPTTSRALILRNGKYGSQGTGEVMLMSKMSGREKLDLLAENLVEESKKAILSPFRIEKCLKMAESQSDAYVDDIANLREPDTFRYLIEAELQARTEPTRTDPRRNPSHVAKLVATRIHNSYMLASAWKIVSDTMNGLVIDGLTDKNVKLKLKNNPDMRDRYLVLYDLVNVLVEMSQDRFSVLATTAPHYAKYFKLKPTEGSDPGETEYVFDWKDLRKAADSFLDSIIIELCFPRGIYPKAILIPREAKRFPQALWDAVGDLSISVELQELLEASLFGPEGEAWKQQPRQMPEEYESWIDAQIYSGKASNMFAAFKDIIFPLEKTRNRPVLDNMWKQINNNYISVSGFDIDSLWQLEDAFNYEPQWSAFSMPKIDEDSDGERPAGRALVKKNNKQAKLLAIANGGSDDSDGSMPGLQSVSNSDDEDEEDEDTESEEEEEDGESDDDESGYNTEEEDEIRDMIREAMDAAHEADWFDSGHNVPKEIDPFAAEDRKGNPFLKLLGSLRGRMFSASPKLKTATRAEPRAETARRAFRATPSGIPKQVPSTLPPKPEPAPPRAKGPAPTAAAQPAPPPAKNQRATVEDVEDEDDIAALVQKKKKKKPKKKKKVASHEVPPTSPSPSIDSMTSAATQNTLSSSLPPPKSSQLPPSPKPGLSKATPYMSSTASLPLGETTTAQSAHSYLQSLNIKSEKKVKSRPDHASLFSNTDEKKGFFSKISTAAKGKDKEKEMQEAKQSWFSKLGKKTTGLMHQLLQPPEERKSARAPMKWESFLKLMREMGFEYDPSTAGSSVRFDPPNKNDRVRADGPDFVCTAHPDPTLEPPILHAFAKRLKKAYGWDEQDLLKLDGKVY